MNNYKLKVLSVYKIHWIYCNYVAFSTDGIIFRKEGDSKVYYLDGKENLVLQAYHKIDGKWIKYYDAEEWAKEYWKDEKPIIKYTDKELEE